MNLTGNKDTDIAILASLSLSDFNRFCTSNKKILKMCKTNEELKHKMDTVKKEVVRLMRTVDYYTLPLTLIPTDNFCKECDIFDRLWPGDFKNKIIYSIDIIKINSVLRLIIFHFDDKTSKSYDIDQLDTQNILMHLIYDQLVTYKY